METSSATPNNEVLSFDSVTAVANYYGDTSAEAGLAVEFFADYGTAANMLFIRFPIGGNRAHLYGANVSNLTLAQLQAINGTLSVISQGYQYSASINLADVTSFTAAATDIQAALNESLPVAAVTTGDTITPVSVSFTGSANGLLLDVDLDRVGRNRDRRPDFRGRRPGRDADQRSIHRRARRRWIV